MTRLGEDEARRLFHQAGEQLPTRPARVDAVLKAARRRRSKGRVMIATVSACAAAAAMAGGISLLPGDASRVAPSAATDAPESEKEDMLTPRIECSGQKFDYSGVIDTAEPVLYPTSNAAAESWPISPGQRREVVPTDEREVALLILRADGTVETVVDMRLEREGWTTGAFKSCVPGGGL